MRLDESNDTDDTSADTAALSDIMRWVTLSQLRARNLAHADSRLVDELLDALALTEISALRLLEDDADLLIEDADLNEDADGEAP